MRNPKTLLCYLVLVVNTLAANVQAANACPPPGTSIAQLKALKASDFTIEDDASREQLAQSLIPCLADLNPFLRDSIAFEAYAVWSRGNKLSLTTRQRMVAQLSAWMDQPDKVGVRQPFAALVLSELARADRINAYLSATERQNLLNLATKYLQNQRDYRGFDEKQGWRHGIAHGADLLMQLALNPALDKGQLDQILVAVRSQIAPSNGHFYIYGEPERLARPIIMVAMRGQHDDWAAWFNQVVAPPSIQDNAVPSQQSLAKRHNTRAFLLAMFANVRDSKNPQLSELAPTISAALAGLP